MVKNTTSNMSAATPKSPRGITTSATAWIHWINSVLAAIFVYSIFGHCCSRILNNFNFIWTISRIGIVSPSANGIKNGKELEDAKGEDNKYEEREKWGSKAEFLLSCIGLSVGIGNVWRFPYLAYQNGGGAFLVAYVVMLILVGKPLFFAELAIGQFAGLGTFRIWRCFPVGKGIGVAMVLMSITVGIYYNVIMCYTLYYMGQSFRSEVPWKQCYSWWGANENCYVRSSNLTHCWDVEEELAKQYSKNMYSGEGHVKLMWEDKMVVVPLEQYNRAFNNCINGTQTASEQFWELYVLQLTSGIDEIGTLKWDLTLTLFVCWIIVFLGLIKGIKSSGKVVYFTATFPYIILITLVIYGCTLRGASEGLRYFFIPEWGKLLTIQVWRAAAEQLLFSLSLGWGCLIMYASYNKFDNKLYRDAVFVSILDFATSLMSGVVIFAVLGHLSVEMNVDISKVAKGGQGLAFVTYPEALAKLPVPQLWSVLFFFMLFLLAIDSEFSYLENVFTVIYDEYPHLKSKKIYITFVCCMLFFLLGLPCVTQGGQYVLNLMDTYGGGYSGIIVATIETMALMWGYGADRFSYDIKFMLGFRPSLYWRICWKFISPVLLLFVLIYSLWNHTIIKYAGVPYPMWAEILGWFLILVSVIQIPIWAVAELYKNRKNLRNAFRPHPDWGPLDTETRQRYQRQLADDSNEQRSADLGLVNLGMDSLPDSP